MCVRVCVDPPLLGLLLAPAFIHTWIECAPHNIHFALIHFSRVVTYSRSLVEHFLKRKGDIIIFFEFNFINSQVTHSKY